MPTKVDSYKCDVCESHYLTEEDALECERLHTEYDKLEIGNVFYKQDLEYPYMVIVDNGSGHAALYVQKMEGSVEDVFETFDSDKVYIRNNPDDHVC